jgi:YidC/Oxa1 family membrane protein insertase
MNGLRYWREMRAFRRLSREERGIVFYSESGQDWHHFEPVIRALTGDLGRSICYVTSDPDDPGLATGDDRINGFCIGKGLLRTVFFQFLDAGVMVMTMLDLGNLQLKRSINPVHYAFMFHSLISVHMADFEDSYDHYDTILCAGPHHRRELRRREEIAGLEPKNLVQHGYHRLEQLIEENSRRGARDTGEPPHLLLAPSWGDNTILHTCADELIGVLLEAGFELTLRPHWQTQTTRPDLIDPLLGTYGAMERFHFEGRMGDTESLFGTDVMITDWSGAGMDYGLGLEKPVLYVDLPPKSRNDLWPQYGIEPFEIFVRTRIGRLLPPDEISRAPAIVREMLVDPDSFRANVAGLRSEWVYNPGASAMAAAQAIAGLSDEAAAGRQPR